MLIELVIGVVVGYYGKKALDGRNHTLIRKGKPTVEEDVKLKARGILANLKDAWDEFTSSSDKDEGR
jgi:hypothetical protein